MAPDPNPGDLPTEFPRHRVSFDQGAVGAGASPALPTARPAPDDGPAEQLARDEAALALYAGMLGDALVAALPGWIAATVRERAASSGRAVDDAVELAATAAGELALQDVGPRLRRLLAADLDQQDTTPLELLRYATVHATAALRSLDVPEVVRDAHDERLHPEDVYGLAPAALADVDEALAEPGLRWGAAKAHVHLARRRRRDGGAGA